MDQNRSYADAVRGQRDPAQRIREQVCAKTLACMMTADRQSSDDRNGNCIGRVAPHFAGRSRALNRACRDAEIADDLVVFAHNRSEEHTSELQSLMRISYDVFCLKKKNNEETHRHIEI